MMTPERAQGRASAATVQLPTKAGRGVLVPGGFVLTAAHCIDWDGRGAMALGDDYLEPVQTAAGANFLLGVRAVEPVADIAVLGRPDDQVFYDAAKAFDEFCAATSPVPVSSADFDVGVAVPVHILTHTGACTRARATRHDLPGDLPGGKVGVTAESGIESGTSGGPVIDDGGRLVAVVSFSGGPAGNAPLDGMMPRPHLALPGWIWRCIRARPYSRGKNGVTA